MTTEHTAGPHQPSLQASNPDSSLLKHRLVRYGQRLRPIFTYGGGGIYVRSCCIPTVVELTAWGMVVQIRAMDKTGYTPPTPTVGPHGASIQCSESMSPAGGGRLLHMDSVSTSYAHRSHSHFIPPNCLLYVATIWPSKTHY